MLSNDGVWARIIFAFCFFLLSGSQMVTGWPATICGVVGTMELASGLLGYSPLVELLDYLKANRTD